MSVSVIINAFDITARQSFVVEMIENKEDLGNAIALNSSMVNGARMVGPSITGILIAFTGEGVCFLINRFKLCGHHHCPTGDENSTRGKRLLKRQI